MNGDGSIGQTRAAHHLEHCDLLTQNGYRLANYAPMSFDNTAELLVKGSVPN